jgi:hypothetical protein
MTTEPPNPWYMPQISTHYFTCKLAGGYGTPHGMTEEGYFEHSFHFQKCEGKGAPTPAYRKERYLGCYHDDSSSPALAELISGGSFIPIFDCAEICRSKGYHYFGKQANGQCWCGGLEVADTSYAKYGQIAITSSDYCGDCAGQDIGAAKNCVFRILDQFDIDFERSKHPCSHITFQDLRRYCYVACRDKHISLTYLSACNTMSIMGLQELNKEIEEFSDSPMCDNSDCSKKIHPLGKDVGRGKGTF